MKRKTVELTEVLNEKTVDRAAQLIEEFMTQNGCDRKECVRVRLSAENMLLSMLDHYGSGETEVTLLCSYSFGQPHIRIRLAGSPFNPVESDGMEEWSRFLFSNLRAVPVYSYTKNTNSITFQLQRKERSRLWTIGMAVVLAVVLGLFGGLIPGQVRTSCIEHVLTPLCNAYISMLNFFCIPLIFLSMVLGICGLGDASSFEKIGKRMLRHFLGILLLSGLIATGAAFLFFSFRYGDAATGFSLSGILEMLLGFLPTGLLSPLIDCNAMQLIIMGVFFGIAMLKLGPRTDGMKTVLSDLNNILLTISQWFTYLIPFFVFAILLKNIWSGTLSEILAASKSWLLTTLLQAGVFLALALQVRVSVKCPLSIVFRKIAGTFLISLGTGSCSVAIPEIYDCCGKMGISPQISTFGIPVGTTVFKPACVVRLVALCYFMANAYGMSISIDWIILVILMAVLFSIAVPAIPGGMFLFYPMLFTQLGIPLEAITAMLATDVFFDVTCTAFCIVSTELALLQQAHVLGMLDRETLQKPSQS